MAFVVQLVRRRRQSGAPKKKLQALQKRFWLTLDGQQLQITTYSPPTSQLVRQPSPAATTIGRYPILHVSDLEIETVRIKRKLLKFILKTKEAFVIRMKDEDDAFELAELIMERWGIDPLVETAQLASNAADANDIDMKMLATAYVNNPAFRSMVLAIHEQLDRYVWAIDGEIE